MYPIEKYQFKTFSQKNDDGTTSTVVVALTTYNGKVVRGVAKCLESDDFSLETGAKLAAYRCDLKVCKKKCRKAGQRLKDMATQIDKLNSEFTKMVNRYDDLLDEYHNSTIRLNNLERDLRK